jgi:hypothetical protein
VVSVQSISLLAALTYLLFSQLSNTISTVLSYAIQSHPHLHGSRICPTHTQTSPDAAAMRPNLDPESELKPEYLPPDAKLEAGYIRYIRILPMEEPHGAICFETCIRRSQFDNDSDNDSDHGGHQGSAPERFHYCAISYAWGDPAPSHAIIVDGQRRLVATNMWHFLERIHLRYERPHHLKRVLARREQLQHVMSVNPSEVEGIEDRIQEVLREKRLRTQGRWFEDWLWIDALCIDQSDLRERTHQVGIMSEIFGRANQVIS